MGAPVKYPFHAMEVGRRITWKPEGCDAITVRRFHLALCQHSRNHGKRFHAITVPGGVWVEREA